MSITINIHTEDDFNPHVKLLRGGHTAPFASIEMEGAALFITSPAGARALIHAGRVAQALLETPPVCSTCGATEGLEHHAWTALADGSVTIHWLCSDIRACNDRAFPPLAALTAAAGPQPAPGPETGPDAAAQPAPEPRSLPGEARCSTREPGGYICTARRGHGGNHTAHDQAATVCQVWPQEPAPAPAG